MIPLVPTITRDGKWWQAAAQPTRYDPVIIGAGKTLAKALSELTRKLEWRGYSLAKERKAA